MKCTIPEISWHNRDPILSLDIQQTSPSTHTNGYRLATGGTDTHVLIWQLCILDNGAVSVEMMSDLTRHNRPVNAVRFSPDGNILASSDDEAAIILWKKNEDVSKDIFIEENEHDNKEHWTIFKMLRGHIEDVYDLCWSKCSQFLVSGSVDNSAILWDISKGKNIGILKDHKGFVQGVSWDPKGQYISTLCSDRCLRVYNMNSKKILYKVQKAILPQANQEEGQKSTNLFFDDTLKSFCRRLSFSPDGELLMAPSGILEDCQGKFVNVIHIFTRSMLNRPVMCLPTQDKFTIAVRFCPILFELKTHQKVMKKDQVEEIDETMMYTDMFDLPYRMVFAVATQNSVLIYDTQQPIPFAKISNIHYTRLSDLSWSSNGLLLVISSTDGYCSLVSFSENELGTPYISPVHTEDSTISPKTSKDDLTSPSEIMSSKTCDNTSNVLKVSVKSSNNLSDKSSASSTDKLSTSSMDKSSITLSSNKLATSSADKSSDTLSIEKSVTSLSSELKSTPKSENSSKLTDKEIIDIDDDSASEVLAKDDSASEVLAKSSCNQKAEIINNESTCALKSSPIQVKARSESKPGKRIQLITLSTKVVEKESTVKKLPSATSISNEDKKTDESNEKQVTSSNEVKARDENTGNQLVECSQSPKISKQGPKTPRRVSLITLSSPKSSKVEKS